MLKILAIQVMKTDAKYHHVPRWFEYISQLGASLLVGATGRLFRDYDYIQEKRPQAKKSAKKSKIPRKPEDELCYESEDDEVMSPQERASRYNQDQEGYHAKTKGQPLLTLEYLVSSMSIFDVTNPHDSVYALLGIAKDTTPTAINKRLRVTDHTQAALEMFTVKKQYPVDYQASYIDICKEFIQFCVRRNVRRDPSRALDVICRPWASEIEERDNEPVLPSWLPRLSKASYGMVLGPGIDGMRMGRTNADSLVGLPNVTHRNYNAAETKGLDKKTFRFRKRQTESARHTNGSKTLAPVVQNSGVSTSSEAGSPLAQANGLPKEPASPTDVGSNEDVATIHVNGSATKVLQENGVATPQSSEVSLNHFSLYVKGFILDTIAGVQPSSQSGSIPTAWARFAGWEQMEGTPPEHFWRTLVADRGSDGKNPPVYYSRACQESFRKGGTTQGIVDTMGLIEHERNSVVAQFCRRVQAAIWNRGLVRTQAGRLGLVANNVNEGDLVCILYGCSVPVALRRHGLKKQSVMDCEMRSELQYIVDYVVQSYRTHLARREIFRDKREKDKAEYRKWELTKRKEWKEDEKWKEQWQLVRAGLARIHEFRAWVTKKRAIVLENAGDVICAEGAIYTMRNYVHILLPRIYEIAAWAAKLGDNNGTIIDRLRSSTSDASTPELFKLTSDQIALWDQFVSDTDWSDKWNAENKRYVEEEGLKVWSSVHKHKNGYAVDKQGSMKKWEEALAKEWTQEWATENSWFLCIDPFRTWLREKGKFYGPEEVLDSKQEWEDDDEWHSKRDKEELEIVSFNAWMDGKGRENPELDMPKADVEIARFEEWRPIWRAENRDADMLAERDAWDAEWQKQKTDSERRRLEEVKNRKERAEKLDKEPFLERWRKGWCPPTVNWQEFEIALSYGKHWLKLVRRRKRDHVNNQGEWWATPHAVKQRQQVRASHLPRQYGYRAPAVNGAEVDGSSLQEAGQTSNQNGSICAIRVQETTQSAVPANPSAGSPRHPKDVANGNFKPTDDLSPTVERAIPRSSEGIQDDATVAGAKGDIKGVDDEGKRSATSENSDTKAVSANDDQASSTSAASMQRRAISEHSEDLLSDDGSSSKRKIGFTNGKPATLHLLGDHHMPFGPPKRSRTYAEQQEEDQKVAWHESHQTLLEARFVSRDELKDWIEKKKAHHQLHWETTMKTVDEQHKAWEQSTPKFLGKDGKFHYDLSRPKLVKEPAKLYSNPQERDERQTVIAAKRAKCRYPKGHYFESKRRARLTPAEQTDYMSKVKETFLSRLGDDGQWYYEMLGECYVHGMMDGEAMAHQNDKGIPPAVFEIR